VTSTCSPRWRWCGKTDIPDEVASAQKYAQEKGFPLVYLAMGSSGRPEFIKKCLELFSNQEMVVISHMKKMLEKDEKTKGYLPSKNVFLCDWLPADKVNPLCDVALIHGGQGTVYTAILSGTPFCAIGNGNPEQEFNVEAAVEHGFAKLYRRNQVKPEDLINGLKELLNDPEAKRKVEEMSALLQRPEWNGEKRAAKKIIELFG
jgi:UDP:flavonoid glycosyltransferase YjiC (YdhE family)